MSGFGVGVLMGGLRVITSTPDALCPPVTAAQDAVAARVGEVEGQELVLHYRVARDTEGGQVLVVDLMREGTPKPLLHRELSLTELSCADAATVIAVQVESYFSGIGSARSVNKEGESAGVAPPDKMEPRAQTVDARAVVRPRIVPGASGVGTSGPSASAPSSSGWGAPAGPAESPFGAPTTGRSAFRFEGRLGATSAAVPMLAVSLRHDTGHPWNLFLTGAVALREQSFVSEVVAGRYYLGWLSAGLNYRWTRNRWRWSLGPTLALVLQAARATGPGTGGIDLSERGNALRAIPAVGVEAEGEFWFSRSLGLTLGAEGGPLLGAWSPSIRVQGSQATEPIEVLRPPDFFLLGWVGVVLGS